MCVWIFYFILTTSKEHAKKSLNSETTGLLLWISFSFVADLTSRDFTGISPPLVVETVRRLVHLLLTQNRWSAVNIKGTKGTCGRIRRMLSRWGSRDSLQIHDVVFLVITVAVSDLWEDSSALTLSGSSL